MKHLELTQQQANKLYRVAMTLPLVAIVLTFIIG